MRKLMVAVIAALAGAAWGDPLTDVYDASTGYVTLDKSDGYSYCSFTNGWGWSDGEAPHATTNYFIGREQMRTPKDNKGGTRFLGKRLVLRTANNGTCAVHHPSGVELDLTYPEVEFIRGNYNINVAGSCVTFEKTIVSSPATDPFRFVHGQPTTVLNTTLTTDFGTITGGADKALKFENTNGKPIIVTYKVLGDFSGYQGQLLFRNQASALVTQASLGGAQVFVGTGCVFRCANTAPTFTVGGLAAQDAYATLQFDTTNRVALNTLSLAGGSTLQVKLDWEHRALTSFDVAESVTVTDVGKPKLIVSGDWGVDTTKRIRFPLITLPEDKGTLSEDMFELVCTKTTSVDYGLLPREFEMSVETKDGYQTLYVGYRDIVKKIASDSNGSWRTDSTLWRDGILPSEGVGKDFYVPSSINMYLMLPDTTPESEKHVVFGGESLTVRGSMFISGSNVSSFSVPELVFCNGGLTSYGGGFKTNVLGGADQTCFTFKGGTVSFLNAVNVFTYQSRIVLIDSEVLGNGTLTVSDRGGGYDGGSLWMTQMNTNFIGKLGFKANSDRTGVCFEANYSRYIVNDQRNLGGARSAFAADAVTFNYYGAVVALNDLTLDEPTRGFTVASRGQFIAENGAAMAIKNRLAFSNGSELRLRNGRKPNGRIALGGAGAAPTLAGGAGSATLSITNTTFTALSADAVEGLNVRFDAGTTLCVNPSATGDLATSGIRNTTGSIASGRADGKIPVEFDYGDMPIATLPKKVAICTVTSDSTLTKTSFEVNPPQGCSAAVGEPTDNGDGTKTFSATLTFTGLTVTENISMDCSKLTLELDITDVGGADTLTVELKKKGDTEPTTKEVTPLAVGLREVVFDGLSAGDYTYQIKLSGTYKGEDFIREEEPVAVSLAEPSSVTPQDRKFVLSANGTVDLTDVDAGNYTVSSASGKKCHLKWTDANGKYAVMSEGTLTVMEGRPENGLDSFMSYVLGLDPTDSTATTYIAAENDSDADYLTLTMPNVVNPRSESETGVEVSYAVQTSSDPSFSSYETGKPTKKNSFKADLPTTEGKVRYYRVQIDMK